MTCDMHSTSRLIHDIPVQHPSEKIRKTRTIPAQVTIPATRPRWNSQELTGLASVLREEGLNSLVSLQDLLVAWALVEVDRLLTSNVETAVSIPSMILYDDTDINDIL